MVRMELKAHILSNDAQLRTVFQQALQSLGAEVVMAGSAAEAASQVANDLFDIVIVDCDGVKDAPGYLGSLRTGRTSRNAVKFAVLDGRTPIRTVYEMGVHFAVEKPVGLETVQRCLRVAHGMIFNERRKYFRHPVDARIFLRRHTGDIAGQMTNISGNGMAITFDQPTKLDETAQFQFTLPGTDTTIELEAAVVWQLEMPKKGIKAGVQFKSMLARSRRTLERWLDQQAEGESGSLLFQTAERVAS